MNSAIGLILYYSFTAGVIQRKCVSDSTSLVKTTTILCKNQLLTINGKSNFYTPKF